tara:strand:+ start:389 stop:550 length:162 start_codon:yes stop_codon:yes gene_type:complete
MNEDECKDEDEEECMCVLIGSSRVLAVIVARSRESVTAEIASVVCECLRKKVR